MGIRGMRAGRFALATAALGLAVAGCSSSSGGGTPSDDAGASNTFKCGNGSLMGSVRITDVTTIGPIAGATVSGPGCTTATTDERGYVTIASDPGVLLKVSFSAPGYVNAYTEATVLAGGFTEPGADYPDSAKASLVPQLDATHGYIFVGTGGDGGDSGPCASGTGSTLSVKDHPEIKVSYLTGMTTTDPAQTATAGFGTVIGPMPPGTYEVDATKPGCKSVGHNDGFLAFGTSIAVQANVVSIMQLSLAAQ